MFALCYCWPKPAEKRALDLLADWPWILQRDMADLLGVSETRISRLMTPLQGFGLVARPQSAGGRLALTDRGLAFQARRDRASVGVARRRWSVAPIDDAKPMDWRNVSGGRSRQLLSKHRAHRRRPRLPGGPGPPGPRPGVGHGPARPAPPGLPPFPLRTARCVPSYPDAFGVLRRGPATWAFFLEWERRAVRPATMAQRLAPYLRYYASHRPTDDHGVTARRPGGLRPRHPRHPLPGPGGEGDGAGRSESSPVGVQSRRPSTSLGPLGRGWRTPGDWEPARLPPAQ